MKVCVNYYFIVQGMIIQKFILSLLIKFQEMLKKIFVLFFLKKAYQFGLRFKYNTF